MTKNGKVLIQNITLNNFGIETVNSSTEYDAYIEQVKETKRDSSGQDVIYDYLYIIETNDTIEEGYKIKITEFQGVTVTTDKDKFIQEANIYNGFLCSEKYYEVYA